MIVKVKPSPNQPREGYLALRQATDGAWSPIIEIILPTPEAAIAVCFRKLNSTLENAIRCIERAQAQLPRLRDSPGPTDRLCIYDQFCIADEDGAVTLPPHACRPRPPHLHPDFHLEGPLLEVLLSVLDLEDDEKVPRRKASALVVDQLLNNPIPIVVAIADTHPQLLGEVVALLVAAARSERNRTGEWP